VSRIGGEFVDVHVMVGPGQSPHTYEPTSRQLSELAGGRLYFSVGVAFEASLVPRIERSFKEVKVVDTSAGIALLPMLEHGDERGTVAPPGNAAAAPHSHDTGGLDPHVWLSPRLAVRIAANIRDALSRTDPARTTVYAENFDRLEKELTRVDAEITELLSPYKGREFFVFHPAYGYFADAYGLTQVAIEAEGLAPGPKHLAELIDRAKAQHTTTVFVQPQTSATYAETVAKAIGARVVPLDPLAMNYTENLLGMAHAIAGAYVEK
jgi:zinc transport system substrate-binding protein